MAMLEVSRLCVRFGGLTAVSRLDFSVDEGALGALIGPNGAGKTTAFNVGMRLPAHLASSGLAMLACRDAESVRRLLPSNALPLLTGRGPSTQAELLRELAATQRRGYSIDDEYIREGVYCYGAPVFDAAGQAVAGVGVCVHKGRLGPDRGARARSVVLDAALGLSQRLGWQAPAGRTARASRKSTQ
jgi:DNA-binding IclR family transcriptional regulator